MEGIKIENFFGAMPASQFMDMRLLEYKSGFVKTLMPLKKEFLTHHGKIVGYAIFAIANIAGVFAAITAAKSPHVVLQSILSGNYKNPVLLEENFLVATAEVIEEENLFGKRGNHKKFLVKVTVENQEKELKGEFQMKYALI